MIDPILEAMATCFGVAACLFTAGACLEVKQPAGHAAPTGNSAAAHGLKLAAKLLMAVAYALTFIVARGDLLTVDIVVAVIVVTTVCWHRFIVRNDG